MEWIEWIAGHAKQNPLGILGLAISLILAFVKIYETFWKDRLSLATSYFFTSHPGEADEIVIANLSPIPVQIAYWTIAWEKRWYALRVKDVDVTPEDPFRFKVLGRDSFALRFRDNDKFPTGGSVAANRRLVLRLHVFGRRRPVKLVVGAS
ncbi:hypothetical protein [Phaeobacter piscinae]|uniref:Uncharacterized protein n=1 Tax=Phaeobacter piscinae TaxID=1580596 RepID=A0AAN1L9M4_9RHOB|nr:hypothetical protein [Phaeobacter piscinae]ATG42631.1 hypothetical protein PhaeoP13_00670 [Phaeobacter piscinae]